MTDAILEIDPNTECFPVEPEELPAMQRVVVQDIHRGFLATRNRGPAVARQTMVERFAWHTPYEKAAIVLRDGVAALQERDSWTLKCVLGIAGEVAYDAVCHSFSFGKYPATGRWTARLVAKCLQHGISERTAIRYALTHLN